jgi:hypothetical protein
MPVVSPVRAASPNKNWQIGDPRPAKHDARRQPLGYSAIGSKPAFKKSAPWRVLALTKHGGIEANFAKIDTQTLK